jgi:polyphosphate kinase
VFLGRLIGHYLADLFPGTRILGVWLFRVTRNSELYIDEEEPANLLKAVETEVHNRRQRRCRPARDRAGLSSRNPPRLLGTLASHRRRSL